MTKHKKRRTLTVRVEYEPNRFSRECLQQTYQAFSPTTTVRLNPPLDSDEVESDQEISSDPIRPYRKPQ